MLSNTHTWTTHIRIYTHNTTTRTCDKLQQHAEWLHVCSFPNIIFLAHAGHITCLIMHMCFACEWNIHTFVFQCNLGVLPHVWWTRNVFAFGSRERSRFMVSSVILWIVRFSFFSLMGLPHIMLLSPFQHMRMKSEESNSKSGDDHQNDREHIYTYYHACWFVFDVLLRVIMEGA